MNDPVNHPTHYTFGKYEVIDVLMDWFPEAPLLWQVVKYVSRAKHKGNYLQDLKKAEFYLQREIKNAIRIENENQAGSEERFKERSAASDKLNAQIND